MTIEQQAGRNPVEEVAEEFLARYRRGERPAVSEYTSRYPELAAEIQDLFPALIVLEEAGPREGDRPSAFRGRIMADGRTPNRLGEYRIVREIGRGGMGVVYEAVQEPLGRHVALKVLPYEAAADTTCLKRFTREARAAARLHHTNIVPVFDVGEHEGVHYYAMQFIQGQGLDEVLAELRRVRLGKETAADEQSRQITASVLSGRFVHADSESLTAEEGAQQPERAPLTPSPSDSITSSVESGSPYFRSVARLGFQAAEALAYAHGERVLHRDIKPSNLLLDVYGRLWVMDFGLAKDDSEDITRAGDVVGTLRYMAPERFSGPSDARADVYSLGLTLYEFLTLRPAFEESDRARLVRRITREEPAAPRRLDRNIPRDLETIVLKAIAKEPNRRYQSAAAMAEDLRRFLADRPILARRTSWAGHTSRWCRRNPMAASLLAVIGLIVTGSVVGLTGLYLNANRERQRAETAEEKWKTAAGQAEREATQARRAEAETKAVLDFFQKRVLSAAAPKGQHGGLGREATIRAAVDQAAPTIAGSFAPQPLVEASIRQVLGHTYFFAGEYSGAIEQHQRALALRSTHLAPDHPDTLKSMVSLAQDYDADSRGGEALKLYQQALALCQTKLGPKDPETLWSMRGVAKGLLAEGRVAEALPLYEEALKRAKVALGSDSEDTLIYMSNLANAYRSAGRLAEAIPLFQETLKLQTIGLGPDHPDTLITMNDLAFAYVNAAKFAEGAALFRKTSNVMKKTLGPDHPQTLITMNNLAVAYREGGQPKEALPLLEETLSLKKAKQGPEHESTLITMGHLATAYADVGRLSEASGLFEETLRLQKATLDADYPYRLYFMNQAGACLLKMKKFDQARTLLSDCLALRKKKDPNDWWIFQTKSQLGQAVTGLKTYAEAESLLLEGRRGLVDQKNKIPPRYHGYIGEATQALVNLYDAWGKKDKAAEWRRKLDHPIVSRAALNR
jgi:serine/threonine protein kinase/Tfp pilus assembly protein PilF